LKVLLDLNRVVVVAFCLGIVRCDICIAVKIVVEAYTACSGIKKSDLVFCEFLESPVFDYTIVNRCRAVCPCQSKDREAIDGKLRAHASLGDVNVSHTRDSLDNRVSIALVQMLNFHGVARSFFAGTFGKGVHRDGHVDLRPLCGLNCITVGIENRNIQRHHPESRLDEVLVFRFLGAYDFFFCCFVFRAALINCLDIKRCAIGNVRIWSICDFYFIRASAAGQSRLCCQLRLALRLKSFLVCGFLGCSFDGICLSRNSFIGCDELFVHHDTRHIASFFRDADARHH